MSIGWSRDVDGFRHAHRTKANRARRDCLSSIPWELFPCPLPESRPDLHRGELIVIATDRSGGAYRHRQVPAGTGSWAGQARVGTQGAYGRGRPAEGMLEGTAQ